MLFIDCDQRHEQVAACHASMHIHLCIRSLLERVCFELSTCVQAVIKLVGPISNLSGKWVMAAQIGLYVVDKGTDVYRLDVLWLDWIVDKRVQTDSTQYEFRMRQF